MELTNLPPEILHHILSVMSTRGMAHLMCCNKQFSELRNSMEYWQQIYRREFPKVSLTRSSVDKTDWYSLNRYAKAYDTINSAIKATDAENRTLFIAPGLYKETFFDQMDLPEDFNDSRQIELIGLSDHRFVREALLDHSELVNKATNGNIVNVVDVDVDSKTMPNYNPYAYNVSWRNTFAKERQKFVEKFKWTGTLQDPVEPDAVIIQGSDNMSTFVLQSNFSFYFENLVIRQVDEENTCKNHFGIAATNKNLRLKNCKLSARCVSCVFIAETEAVFDDCLFYASTQSGVFASVGSSTQFNNCLFANCLTGVSANNHFQVDIKDCTFINCEDQGAMFEGSDKGNSIENSTVILSGSGLDIRVANVTAKNNKLCCNTHGIFSAENCEVVLDGNEISYNIHSGVVLRPFSHFRVINNVFKSNAVALQVAHSRSAPVVSLDDAKKDNVFINNQEDISENVKGEGDTEFAKGLNHFDKGSAHDTSAAVKRAYSLNVCTFCATGYEYHYQTWYECITCGLSATSGVCAVCKDICHKGHEIVPTPQFNLFYCDCGSTRDCEAIDKSIAQLLKEEFIQEAVNEFAFIDNDGLEQDDEEEILNDEEEPEEGDEEPDEVEEEHDHIQEPEN